MQGSAKGERVESHEICGFRFAAFCNLTGRYVDLSCGFLVGDVYNRNSQPWYTKYAPFNNSYAFEIVLIMQQLIF